ncbi:MAG: AAA family ATPase [Rhodobacteraceae bacterium]|nr:AAA family ATPase [Paracoccaceae bacterium]
MQNAQKSIVLIGNDPGAISGVSLALREMPGVTLDERQATLSELNGTAIKLASRNDLIIFQTDFGSEGELDAIAGLRAGLNGNATLLALTNESASLADVRRLTRAGVDDVLPDTISPEELAEQIARLSRRNEAPVTATAAPQIIRGKVISVAKAQGGVGSTTVAVNLADELLGRTGMLKKVSHNRVVVVDLDLQFGAVANFLDVPPSDALYELAMDGAEPDATFLSQSLTELPSGLSVLAAPSRFAPLEALKPTQIARLIELLQGQFDYVVVDMPRALVDWLSPILEKSDRMLMVTDSTVPSIRQARRLIDFFTEDNLSLQIDIVINNEKKPLVQASHHVEASKVLERPFNHWIPDDPRAAREAMDRGAPLTAVAGRSSLSKGIHRLGRDLMASLKQQPGQASTTKA